MGGDDQGSPAQPFLQVVDDLFLAVLVEGCGRLVEQQDRRVLQQYPGQPHRLALAAGEAGVALDRHVQPQRVGAYESTQPHAIEGLQQFLVAQRGIRQVEVFPQAAVEQRHILRQVTDATLAVGRVELAQSDVVQQQPAGLRIEQATEQPQQGRLAGAVAAEQRHPLAGLDVQRMHIDYRWAVAMGQAQRLQAVMPVQPVAVHEALAGGPLLLGGHQLVEALQGHLGMLPTAKDGGSLGQRSDGPRGQDRTGHQGADGHRAVANPVDAEHHHPDVAQLLDDARRIAEGRGQGVGLHCGTGQFPGEHLPLLAAAALGTRGLDRLKVFEGFQQHAVLHRTLAQVLP